MTNIVKLKTSEKSAIEAATANGHLNPRKNDRQNSCLYADGADRKIIEYLIVDLNNIISDKNIRFKDIDEVYCRIELAPLMERKLKHFPNSYGLDYPLFVVKRGKNYELAHGHNRFYCLLHVLKLAEVPVFVIEDKGTPMQKLYSKIKPNSKKADHNRPYTRQCIVEQLKMAKAAGYFKDISNEKVTKDQFHLFMNKFHPNQFVSNITRGKIFKGFYENNFLKNTSTIPTRPATYIDNFLYRNGYSLRYSIMENGKRKPIHFPHYTCERNKAIILYGARNDHHFMRNLWNLALEWETNPDYRKAYKNYSIHVIPWFSKETKTVPELNTKRSADVNRLTLSNKLLKNLEMPLIEKVIYPMQLTSEKVDKVFLIKKK